MEIKEKLYEYVEKINGIVNSIETEEATKTALIMPFFQLLGYDVFNPTEFIPEYTADVGIKKGEKVDYAIAINEVPLILIECKPCVENINKYTSQLYRYFGTTVAKFAILTNGIEYNFYTDLEKPNIMDTKPFLSINLLELKDRDIIELTKFTKDNLDIDKILNSAENLKYSRLIKEWFSNEVNEPSDDFVRLILNSVYDGVKTQKVIETFTPMIKKAISQYISDSLNEKIQTALNSNNAIEINNETDEEPDNDNKINTTIDELESYAIVKSILRNIVDANRIYYKDTQSYFGILLDNNIRKWICRVDIRKNKVILIIPDENKKEIKYNLSSIDELYNYGNEIIEACKRYL